MLLDLYPLVFEETAAAEAEDSRGWPFRRHARTAVLQGLGKRASIKRPAIAASAAAQAFGASASGRVGFLRASATSLVGVTSTARQAASGRANVMASARQPVAGVSRATGLTGARVAGNVQAFARGNPARGWAGQPSVGVGPDLVVEEFEEILFLVEVA